MALPQHHRAFLFCMIWTLGLLWLGSAVHVTGSSLACPDWPTCYGSMIPEMEGGIFWEHLHRLVAGGLVILWIASTWLARKEEPARSWIWKAAAVGILLLLIQSVLGGLTVIFLLPTAISSSHLTLAFLFLGLATLLYAVTSPGWGARIVPELRVRRQLRRWAIATLSLILLQSVVGALVRHMGAGMACPDFPLCLGAVIPPLDSPLIAIHFLHRVIGVALGVVGVILGLKLRRAGERIPRLRRVGILLIVMVLFQIFLGFASVLTIRAFLPTSLHTLGAALLVVLTVLAAAWSHETSAGGSTPA